MSGSNGPNTGVLRAASKSAAACLCSGVYCAGGIVGRRGCAPAFSVTQAAQQTTARARHRKWRRLCIEVFGVCRRRGGGRDSPSRQRSHKQAEVADLAHSACQGVLPWFEHALAQARLVARGVISVSTKRRTLARICLVVGRWYSGRGGRSNVALKRGRRGAESRGRPGQSSCQSDRSTRLPRHGDDPMTVPRQTVAARHAESLVRPCRRDDSRSGLHATPA